MRILLVLFSLFGLTAGDWPQWRGPNRDGAAGGSAPAVWPEKLTRKWRITVGEGHSSPVVAGGKIFVFAREGENEVVRAVDPGSGRVEWQQSYAAPFKMNMAATAHGPGPKSTPVYGAGKLCTLGIGGVSSCFDAKSGRVLWRQDFKSEYKETWPTFGTAMSPIIDGALLIEHVGSDSSGALTAFDLNTGTTKWKWNGDGAAYASPVIAEIGGVRQLITQSRANVVSLSSSTGELLWKIPFHTPYEQNSVTPVVYGETLILSGLDNGVMRLRASKDAKGWHTERVWDNQQASMYMSTPVVSGDLLFGFGHKNKGQFFCVDLRNGQTVWTSGPRQGENAAIIRQGDILYLLRNDATLMIARASGKSWEVVREYAVADSPTWAHPAVLDDGVMIKDKTSLTFWSWK